VRRRVLGSGAAQPDAADAGPAAFAVARSDAFAGAVTDAVTFADAFTLTGAFADVLRRRSVIMPRRDRPQPKNDKTKSRGTGAHGTRGKPAGRDEGPKWRGGKPKGENER